MVNKWIGAVKCFYMNHQCEIKTRFDQNVEYKGPLRPAGVYPLRDFHKICRVCTLFQDALAVKISLICSRGYGVMGVITVQSLVGLGFHPLPGRPKTLSFYSAPQCSHCKHCSSYSISVCPSVRPSVTRRYVSKRRHVARCSFHCQIAKCV